MTDPGARAADRLAQLAGLSAPGPGVTRLPFTEHHRAALDLLRGWMEGAGLQVRLDDAGTLIGRLDGPEGAPTFLMGSHQDSVREGGAYDGIMGVVLPLLALERLRAEGVRLPFTVEILAFADEEGVRFPTALLGPRALAGTVDMGVLDMQDADGVTLRAAMEGFGLHPDAIPGLARPPAGIIGYLETHIEQGPVLERAGQALGVVTAICGIERHPITVTGQTGHAGTLPMEGRRDALVGAAALVAEVHRLAQSTDGLLGTVGYLEVAPNAVNAVPREVRLTAEFRVGRRCRCATAAVPHCHRFAAPLLGDRSGPGYRHPPQLMLYRPQPASGPVVNRLENGDPDRAAGLRLASGATHDARAWPICLPGAMCFRVACRDGVRATPRPNMAVPRYWARGPNRRGPERLAGSAPLTLHW